MTFVAASGDWTNVKIPTKATTTYTEGMIVANDGTNDVPVTAQTQQYVRGIVIEAKASSSATTSIHLQVPRGTECTFYGDMTSGETLDPANVGAAFDFAADGLTVSTNTSYKPLTLVKYISSTKGEFKLNLTTGIEN